MNQEGEESGKTHGTHICTIATRATQGAVHTMSYIHTVDYKLLQDKMSVSITDVPLNGFVPHTVAFNMVLLEL